MSAFRHTYKSVFVDSSEIKQVYRSMKESRIAVRRDLMYLNRSLAGMQSSAMGSGSPHFKPVWSFATTKKSVEQAIEAEEFLKQAEHCFATSKPLWIAPQSTITRFDTRQFDGHAHFQLRDADYQNPNDIDFVSLPTSNLWHSIKDAFDITRVAAVYSLVHKERNTAANLERLQKVVTRKCSCLYGHYDLWVHDNAEWGKKWQFDPLEEKPETLDLFLRVDAGILSHPAVGTADFFRPAEIRIDLAAQTATGSVSLFCILPKKCDDAKEIATAL